MNSTVGRLLGLIAFGVFTVGASEAIAETYTFAAPSFGAPGGVIANWVPGPCGAPNCFTALMTVTGSFTTAGPLPTSATTTVVPLSYTFDDGLTAIASTDPDARIISFGVTTSGTGAITSSNIHVHRWLTAGHGAGDPVDSIWINLAEGQGNRRSSCTVVTADTCTTPGGGPDLSHAETPDGVWAVAVPASIPTMSEWALMLFGVLLAGAAAITIRRHATQQ